MTVPFMAQYAFPSQANKSVKMTPRIPPKNGFVFTPGNVIRLEFPAQGYVNPSTTSLSFDVSLVVPDPTIGPTGPIEGKEACVRFQNNIQSIFSRVRLLYGANPLEGNFSLLILDIINYNVIVRNLTEWTAGNPSLCVDQGTITDGIGNNTIGSTILSQFGFLNTRANLIQGCAFGRDATAAPDATIGRGVLGVRGAEPAGVLSTPTLPVNDAGGVAQTAVATVVVTRRYQVQLALGLMTQEKLIPTKYMASQLAIELTLETPANCIIADMSTYDAATLTAGYVDGWQSKITYCVFNVNLIPEILEFDASYDTAFLQGLQNGGVPIKFSSWLLSVLIILGIHFCFLLHLLQRSICLFRNAADQSKVFLLFSDWVSRILGWIMEQHSLIPLLTLLIKTAQLYKIISTVWEADISLQLLSSAQLILVLGQVMVELKHILSLQRL
jgi:hypothetical protein